MKNLYKAAYEKQLYVVKDNTSKKEKIDRHFSLSCWPYTIYHDNIWFYFQGVFSQAANDITNHAYQPILKSMFKLFSVFVVQY